MGVEVVLGHNTKNYINFKDEVPDDICEDSLESKETTIKTGEKSPCESIPWPAETIKYQWVKFISALTSHQFYRGHSSNAASAYQGWNLLQIEGNLNSNRYVREVLEPKVIPFFQGIPGDIVQQDNAYPHVASNVPHFCSVQHMQLLLWPAYSSDMSPIENEWDLVGRHLAHDPLPTISKVKPWVRIQAIWYSLPQADIQHLFDSMPCHIAALIAVHGSYTKY
ncbi:hypothetical protein TNCV_1182621 [Trichonephila clavipes]|nr:hypothetical protein TNCV_1182621 [Trichonephila clavipes]